MMRFQLAKFSSQSIHGCTAAQRCASGDRACIGSHPDAPIPISNNQSEASLRNSLSCHAWAPWHAMCASDLCASDLCAVGVARRACRAGNGAPR